MKKPFDKNKFLNGFWKKKAPILGFRALIKPLWAPVWPLLAPTLPPLISTWPFCCTIWLYWCSNLAILPPQLCYFAAPMWQFLAPAWLFLTIFGPNLIIFCIKSTINGLSWQFFVSTLPHLDPTQLCHFRPHLNHIWKQLGHINHFWTQPSQTGSFKAPVCPLSTQIRPL